YPTGLPSGILLSLRSNLTLLLMDFSNTLRGITIEGHSPLPQPPYFVFALKTFRSRSLVLAKDAPTGNVFIACDPCAVDGTEEGRRGLPLLWPHRGRG